MEEGYAGQFRGIPVVIKPDSEITKIVLPKSLNARILQLQKNKTEYNLELQKNKQCWLYNHGCPCRTAGCWGLPDDGCPVYRWFKEVIEYQESIK